MNANELSLANLNNLTQLFHVMGAKGSRYSGMEHFWCNEDWPHRLWKEKDLRSSELDAFKENIDSIRSRSIVPIWQIESEFPKLSSLERLLIQMKFENAFTQTAMFLDLQKVTSIEKHSLDIKVIKSAPDIELWTNVAAEAFSYEINPLVIQRAAQHSAISLLMAYVDGHAAATALLFRTDDIIGVHQLGVLPTFRQRGLARKLMSDIIYRAIMMEGKFLCLQASVAAEGLYSSLGMIEQFKINNYWSL